MGSVPENQAAKRRSTRECTIEAHTTMLMLLYLIHKKRWGWRIMSLSIYTPI